MADINLHIDNYLTLDYLEEKLGKTGDISITDESGKNVVPTNNGSYIGKKKQVFDPQEVGDYTIEYNGEQLSVNVYDIPDSEDLHAYYDFSQYPSSQTSNFDDLSQNDYDLTNGSISGMTTINGIQAGDFNGTSDTVYSNSFTGVSIPYTAFMVVDFTATDTEIRRALQLSSDDMRYGYDGRDANDYWATFNENTGRSLGGSSDRTVKLHTVIADGSNSIIRENGTKTVNGSWGSEKMNAIGLGSMQPKLNSQYWQGGIGEVAIYPDRRSSSEIDDVESYLNDKWGLGLSL